MTPDKTTNTSPLTPPFVDEPWRAQRRMTPEEVAPYLAEFKAKLGAVTASGTLLDPEMTARYLAACAARKEHSNV